MIVVESTEGMGDSADSKMDFKWREKILMKMISKSLNKKTLNMLQEMMLWEMMWRFSKLRKMMTESLKEGEVIWST